MAIEVNREKKRFLQHLLQYQLNFARSSDVHPLRYPLVHYDSSSDVASPRGERREPAVRADGHLQTNYVPFPFKSDRSRHYNLEGQIEQSEKCIVTVLIVFVGLPSPTEPTAHNEAPRTRPFFSRVFGLTGDGKPINIRAP